MRRRKSLTKEPQNHAGSRNASKLVTDSKIIMGNSASRFGYLNGKLPKEKASNKNLKNITSSNVRFTPSSIIETFVPTEPTNCGLKTTPKTKSKPPMLSNRIIKCAVLTVAFMICLWTINVASEVLLNQSFNAKKQPMHKKISHEIHIKLSPESISKSKPQKEKKDLKEDSPQHVNLRATSSNDALNIHGRMARPNSYASTDHQGSLTDGEKDAILLSPKEENFDRIMTLKNTPADFFFATSSTKFQLGGYGHLPFPIYCPIVPKKYFNEAIEYINTCEYEHIAWCSSLWIYPLSLTEDKQTLSIKRIIFSNSDLELYLNSNSQLVLEYAFASSKLKLNTNISVGDNEWSQIGVSVVPVNYIESRIKVRLYINGKELASDEIITGGLGDSGAIDTTRLGQDELNDNSFEGHMAMLAIWTKASALAIFRDDFIMKSAYTAGLDTKDLVHLDQRGLVKSPNFLYSLRIPPIDSIETVFEQPIVSLLIERMQKHNGVLFRPNLILDPKKPFSPAGSSSYDEYRDGSNPQPSISSSEQYQYDTVARLRRLHIRNAMKHVWKGYKTYAYGYDELKPLSKIGHNNWGGMCTTLVDALDTLWLMGMKEEFWEGRDHIRENLDFNKVTKPVSVFETTIRNLGGLLSAYDLSGDKMFLEKAEDLGKRMLQVFESPSGLPYGQTSLTSDDMGNLSWLGTKAILAEIGTLQLEFRYLGQKTGNKNFTTKAMNAFDTLIGMNPESGLYSIYINNEYAKPKFATNQISLGAMGDSFYEYLLKVWLQGGKKEPKYRNMYEKSIDGIMNSLVQKSALNELTYVAEFHGGSIIKKMDHLVCFLPATLALGAYTDPNGLQSSRAQRDLTVAKSLAYTCYQMYARTKSGLASEYVEFDTKGDDFSVPRNAKFNLLRPETVESLYVLHHLTGDNIYREWGWEIFRAIQEFCKVDAGYGSLNDVTRPNAGLEDRMESFFLSETMKYLYLLQDPDSSIDLLSKHVLNTEAHPFQINDEIGKKSVFSFF